MDEPVSERRTRTRKMRRRRRREGSSWRQLTPAVPLSRQLSIPVTWSAAVSLPRCTYARRSTSTGGNCDRSEKKCLRRCDEEFRSSPLSSFGNCSRCNGKAPSPTDVEGFALNSYQDETFIADTKFEEKHSVLLQYSLTST